jgi:hypothetical protein
LGPATLGSTVARSSEGLGVFGFGRVGGVEEALRLVIGLDEGDLVFAAAGEAQVAEGFFVDGEDAAGGAVFGGHVADGGAVGEGQFGDAGAVELDEFADDAELAQGFGDGEDEVGGGRAFAQLAGELVADDLGMSMETGWPSMAASASMPPTPQPRTPRPLIMVVWSRCRPACRDRRPFRRRLRLVKTTRARYSRLTWWQMPMPGGTAEKLRKAVWPHFRKA